VTARTTLKKRSLVLVGMGDIQSKPEPIITINIQLAQAHAGQSSKSRTARQRVGSMGDLDHGRAQNCASFLAFRQLVGVRHAVPLPLPLGRLISCTRVQMYRFLVLTCFASVPSCFPPTSLVRVTSGADAQSPPPDCGEELEPLNQCVYCLHIHIVSCAHFILRCLRRSHTGHGSELDD